MYVPPWAIDNFGDSIKSRLYKVDSEYTPNGTHIQKWKLVMEVPQIHEDTEENLRNRIATLVMFI